MGETVEVDEEDLVPGRQFPASLDGFSLEAMLTVYQLQKVCHSRAFQHWEVTQTVTNACCSDVAKSISMWPPSHCLSFLSLFNIL